MFNIIRNLHATENKQNAYDLKERFNEIIEKIKNYKNNDNKEKVIECLNKYLKRNIYIYNYSVEIKKNQINITDKEKSYTITSYENIEVISNEHCAQNQVKKILLALEWFIDMELDKMKQLLSIMEWLKQECSHSYCSLLYAILAAEIESDIKSSAWHMKNILRGIKSFTQSINQNDYNQYKDLINNLLDKAIKAMGTLTSKTQTNQNTYKELYAHALQTVQELKDTIYNETFTKENKQQIIYKLKIIKDLINIQNITNYINSLDIKSKLPQYKKNKLNNKALREMKKAIDKFDNLENKINSLKNLISLLTKKTDKQTQQDAYQKLTETDNKKIQQIQDESLKQIAQEIQEEAEQCINEKAEEINKLKGIEGKYVEGFINKINAIYVTNPEQAKKNWEN